MRAVREGARAREPRGAPARDRRRPLAGAALAHRRRARRSRRVAARAVLGRPRRRRGVGARRARHEGRGRRERGRAGRARARRAGAAAATWSSWRWPTRRSATASGSTWLCEEHPEAVRVDYSVNEGAGDRVELGGRVLYLCSVAEKMTSPFELRVHGRSGHASMPGIADNALVKAAAYIERLARFNQEPRLIPETEGFLAAVLGDRPRGGRSARGRPGGRPARGRAAGAAARRDRGADDGARIRQAQRHPRALHGGDRLPPAPRPDPSRGRARDPRAARTRATTSSSTSRRRGRHTVPRRRPALGCRRVVHRRRGAGAQGRPDVRGGLHRLALAPRGVRHRSPTGSFRRAPWIPSSPRASSTRPTSACRSRISSSACAGCSTPRAPFADRAGERLLLELNEADGAFEAIEAYLAEHLRPGLVADLYLGYGLSQSLRREHGACAARALPPPARRLPGAAGARAVTVAERSVSDRRMAADLGRGRLRGRGRRGARRDRTRRRLPGQPRAASGGAVRGRPRGAPGHCSHRCGPCTPARSAATAGRSSRPRRSSSSPVAATGW